ncbi:hypothetical protein MRB53_021361 [Persea americana]|uniref:Uncharacterized protein n=1 Tax=Persea americana TaxID=3435 RepID=A0ACC2L3P0_PERAE|nr:hypothetical protein MRB53_021361 [Persea americana]
MAAAMAALQSSMAALSLTPSSFLGQRLSPSLYHPTPCVQIKHTDQPCHIVMRLKRWERKKCKPNSLPVLQKMHVKVFRHNSTVIIKDLNLKTKHMKSQEQGQPGQIIKIEAAIHSSNVMLYSKEKEVASRVGHKILEDGTRVRYLIKTGEIIDGNEKWQRTVKEKKEAEVSA